MMNNMHCSDCGHTGHPEETYKGSIRTQIILWFMLIIPGLFYSMWRQGTRRRICPHCGSEALKPLPGSVEERFQREFQKQHSH